MSKNVEKDPKKAKDKTTSKKSGSVRSVDSLGRVVIPKELRRHLNIGVNDELEIYTNDHGEIVLKKYLTECVFCGSTENVIRFCGKLVCAECLDRLNNEFIGGAEPPLTYHPDPPKDTEENKDSGNDTDDDQ